MNPLLLLISVRTKTQTSCIDTTVYYNAAKQTAL